MLQSCCGWSCFVQAISAKKRHRKCTASLPHFLTTDQTAFPSFAETSQQSSNRGAPRTGSVPSKRRTHLTDPVTVVWIFQMLPSGSSHAIALASEMCVISWITCGGQPLELNILVTSRLAIQLPDAVLLGKKWT